MEYNVVEFTYQKRTKANHWLFALFSCVAILFPLVVASITSPQSLWLIIIPIITLSVLWLIEYVNFPHNTWSAIVLIVGVTTSWFTLIVSEQSPIQGIQLYIAMQVVLISVYTPIALAGFFIKQITLTQHLGQRLGLLTFGGTSVILLLSIPVFAIMYAVFVVQEISISGWSVFIIVVSSLLFFIRLFQRDNYIQDIPAGAPTTTQRWRIPVGTHIISPHTIHPDDPSVRILRYPGVVAKVSKKP